MAKSREDILETIRKCLALSTSSNENEAALAAAKAQELLFKYNLSMVEVQDVNEASTVGEDHLKYTTGRNDGFWARDLAFGVAKYNFCEALVGSWRGGNHITFIGEKHNILVAKEIFQWLAAQLPTMMKEAWKSYEGYELKGAFKRGFYEGAVNTIRHRLFEQWMDLQRASEQSTALVVVKEKEIQEYVEEKFPNVKPARESQLSGYHGYQAGVEAGHRVDISVKRKLDSSTAGVLR